MNIGQETRLHVAAAALLCVLGYTGVFAYDRLTWALEVFPVLVGLPLLYASHKRFPLTDLLYAMLFAHALVLLVGGMYTYARVPLGFEMAHWLGIARNPYDKVGHFFQGFAPALLAREILLRGQHVNGRKMLTFVVICIALAISATYELIEWAAALMMGQNADNFLGTQGDPWDTQSDMFMALVGAITALAFFARWQDRQIERLLCTQRTRMPGFAPGQGSST